MEARSISEFSVRTFCTFCFHVSILIGPHCRPYLGKDLCRIHERLEMCFLKLKSVRSCALILKLNSVRWWERAHLCVHARVSVGLAHVYVCVCLSVCVCVCGCVCVCVCV